MTTRTPIVAPRGQLVLAAGGLILITLAAERGLAPMGGVAARAVEIVAVGVFALASALLLAPMGRARAGRAGLVAGMATLWAVYLNAGFVGALDPSDSPTRMVVWTLFVAPAAGVVTGLAVRALARSQRLRWPGKTYSE